VRMVNNAHKFKDMSFIEKIYHTDSFPKIKKVCEDYRNHLELERWDLDSLIKLEQLLQTKNCHNIYNVLLFILDEALYDLDKIGRGGYIDSHFRSIQSQFHVFASEKIESIFNAATMSQAKEEFGIRQPPEPTFIFPDESKKIPTSAGVYFLWDRKNVEYVGRAKNLRRRLTKSHHILKPGHSVSWFELNKKEIISMEYLYIGLLKPKKNIVGSVR
jgi:hypothetical protein